MRFRPTFSIKERMLWSLRSLSCRKWSICVMYVTQGHRLSQAGDTTGDTEDLRRALLACGSTGMLLAPSRPMRRGQHVQPCPWGIAMGPLAIATG